MSGPDDRPAWRSFWVLTLTIALLLATTTLVWFGYRATREWELSTRQLTERRASEVLALLVAALTRDMKGVQLSVLVPINQEVLRSDPPHDLREVFARAFARFPYPESFVVWTATGAADGRTYVFNRADRPPPWETGRPTEDPYPVVLRRDPAALRPLILEARALAAHGKRFALVESQVAGVPYQAIVHLLYRTPDSGELFALVAFTVNMQWVRRAYFDAIARQVARIGGEAEEMSLLILDETRQSVASNGIRSGDGPVRERQFPLVFFDPDLMASLPPPRPVVRHWTARVAPSSDSALDAVATGARRTFMLISFAGLAAIAALVATARAVRASAELAALKSEFASTATHELKTPLALIRLVSDTLAKGRYSSTDTVRDYARLLADQSARLTRLIDNLLMYARVTDLRQAYSFDPVDVVDLVEDALEHVQPRLDELGFGVHVDVPADLPRLSVDRAAMLQVLDNLIDNAIKYSGPARSIDISARRNGSSVHVMVIDRGPGIPREDVPRVFDKFFRGRSAKVGGSGLGLTIARRVVRDHGGRIELRSTPGEGTTVEVSLPCTHA